MPGVAPGRLARRAVAWLPALLVVPLVTWGAVAVSQPDDPAEVLRELVPSELGTTWTYRVLDHGKPSGTRVRQVASQSTVDIDSLDGIAVTSSYTDYPGSGAISDLLYLRVGDDAIEQLAVYANHQHLAVEPPAPAYRLPVEAGESWSYDGAVGEAKLRYDTTLEEVGEVEVSGRTFTGCAHYVTTLQWQYAGQAEFGPEQGLDEWVCPGFGTVRLVDTAPDRDREVTEELVAFHGADQSWTAEDAGLPEGEDLVGDAPGSTVALDPGRTNAVDGEVSTEPAWWDARSGYSDFPPVGADGALVVAERDGSVSAMETGSGEMRWRVQLDGPVVAPVAVAGDRVLVADAAKHLWALSLTDGTAVWVRDLDDVVSVSPVADATTAVVVSDDRRVLALDLEDGREVWSTRLAARAAAPPALDGEGRVVLGDGGGTLAAYDLDDGDEAWSVDLDGAVAFGPLVRDGRVYAADDTGTVYAHDAADGGLVWEHRSFYYASEALAAGEDTLVVVGDGTRVEAYDLVEGTPLWSVPADDIGVAPVVVGEQVVTVDGDRVEVRDLADGALADDWALHRPDDGEVSSRVDPAFADGLLLLHERVRSPAFYDAFVAHPVVPDAARPGVLLTADTRAAPGMWIAPSVLAGDALLVPGSDGTLYRSSGPGEPTEPLLSAKETFLPGVVVAGDVGLTHRDGALVAFDLASGDVLWEYAAPDALPGVLPAVDGDTVYVGLLQEGLAAVDLATGEERWKTSIELAFGTTSPLVVPGGDVVYGGGALGRYDGRTGKLRWTIYDGILTGPAAYADGLVFADVSPLTTTGARGAVDAGTGEVVWSHESLQPPAGLGPTVADGVVVFVDAVGVVTAYTADAGEELWSLHLGTTVAGQPVVVDGVLYVTEQGRREDIRQREFRVSAHDLRTGQFLGAYQPPTAGLGFTLTTGGNAGAVTLPTTVDGETSVVVVRPR